MRREGVRTCKSDGGDPLLEVLKSGGLHLVVTEVVPVDGDADETKELLCCSVFETGTKKDLELDVACLSIVSFAVKS